MDILNFIQEKVVACSYKQLEEIADSTAVPYGTLMKIKAGQTKNPRIKTVQPLYDYFLRLEGPLSDCMADQREVDDRREEERRAEERRASDRREGSA